MRTLEKQATPRPSAFPPAFTPVKNAKQPKQPEYDGILTDAKASSLRSEYGHRLALAENDIVNGQCCAIVHASIASRFVNGTVLP